MLIAYTYTHQVYDWVALIAFKLRSRFEQFRTGERRRFAPQIGELKMNELTLSFKDPHYAICTRLVSLAQSHEPKSMNHL